MIVFWLDSHSYSHSHLAGYSSRTCKVNGDPYEPVGSPDVKVDVTLKSSGCPSGIQHQVLVDGKYVRFDWEFWSFGIAIWPILFWQL